MLNKPDFSHFRGDLFGGVTAAIVSLPLALTFGVASGAGAEAGLYGAMIVGLFAAMFGGTPTLISEPTGPMTVIMAAVITEMIASNPDNGLAMAFTVVVVAGVFQILFGVLKLGNYITLMPHSVISGFMSGIGCILIIMQLAPMLGSATPEGGVLGVLSNLPTLLANISLFECLLAAATIGIVFFCPAQLKRRVPPQLIALIGVSIVSVLLFDLGEINRIGEISIGIPSLVLPTFSEAQWQIILIDGMVLGMLGCIDSMLTSVIADNLTRTEHNSNKELVGQGIANIASGLFGGLPGAGATMGTVINIQSGGRTFLSGVFRVLVLAIAVYGLTGLLEAIPLAVLAGIALKVGVDILDWSFIKRAHRVSWQSTSVMYAVILLTVFVDLIVAVGVGIFIANIIIIEKLSRAQAEKVLAVSDVDDALPLSKDESRLLKAAQGKILLVYLSGPMIFGVAKMLARQQKEIPRHDLIIIDLSDVSMLDDTMSLSVENTIKDAQQMGKTVYFVVQDGHVAEKFRKMGTFDLFESDDLFEIRHAALESAVGRLGYR